MNRHKKDILKQLREKGSGFSVPESYFENLEKRNDFLKEGSIPEEHKSQDRKAEALKSEFISLDQTGKNTGFKVPEGYFETVESNIPNLKEPKIIPLNNQFIRVLSLSIAASILLFFGIQTMNFQGSSHKELMLQDEELATWLESDLIELNTYEIAEAYNDIDLDLTLYAEDDMGEYLNSVDIESLILENK